MTRIDFYGGPLDLEELDVALRPLFMVPVACPVYYEPNPSPEVELPKVAVYELQCDRSGHYYICIDEGV